jgi:hypothetical protein
MLEDRTCQQHEVAHRDRQAEGSQGPAVNQTKRDGGRDRAEARRQAGKSGYPGVMPRLQRMQATLQRDLQTVGQERNEDVGFDSALFLMEDRADRRPPMEQKESRGYSNPRPPDGYAQSTIR